MRRDVVRHGVLITACVVGLVLPITLTKGEVSKTGAPEGARPAPEELSVGPMPELALRAQCWQHGVKIIDRDGLQGLSLKALTEQQAVSFRRLAETGPSVFILPFPDGLCLIQPAP